jgi:hypothetical protein
MTVVAPMTGRCKLCLQDLHLKESHYLPAGIYKILRDVTEKNPNPWTLTAKTAIQTSRQMTARLLCCKCEQRLSTYGENWVLRHCQRNDGSFSLASNLASREPDVASETTTTRIYCAAKIPEIDVSALAYFAASIFWRGSIHPWNSDGSIPVNLGPFREQFRQYLMGEKDFPKDCALWVVVREGKETGRLTHVPVGERKGNFHMYRFPMPGLAFSIMVSKNIPANYREMCFVRGRFAPLRRGQLGGFLENPIIVTTNIEKLIEELAFIQLRKSQSQRPQK